MMTRRRWITSFASSIWLVVVAAAAASAWSPPTEAPPARGIEAGHTSTGLSVSMRVPPSPTQTQPPYAEPDVLVVFVRNGCPHCADAKVFLADYAKDHTELRIVYRPIDEDQSAAADLVALYEELGMWPPGVPTFVMDGHVLVGFQDAEHTGPALRELIVAGLPPRDQVETALFGTLSASRLGLPVFTIALGLLDGFNPCAMWVLLFLLSLLVHLQNRARMALIAGVFVLVSGAVYYAFMAAWLNVFLIVGTSAALRWTLGGVALAMGGVNVKDFFAWGRGFSLSIPASAKPGLYARARSVLSANTLGTSLVAVAALAAVVNVVELLCTAGLPAIYTAVLTRHELNPLAYYSYLGLYILGYVADDTVMVATAVTALGSRKLSEGAGRWLKLLSGIVMLTLGVVLVGWPGWLL
jgi:glutaredoxin